MKTWLRELLQQREFLTLALSAIVVGSAWAFVELADELREEELAAIDQRLLYLLRDPSDPADPIGPRWLEAAMRDATALGSVLVLALLVVVIVTVLWLERHRTAAVWLTVVSLGAGGLNTLFKLLFARERPDLLAAELLPSSFSFPSGHAFLSAAIYLTIAALLTRVVTKPRTRVFVLAAAAFLAVLIGFTRVYLGVHYPSDVLAGWTLGLGWAALCWLVAWNAGKL